MTLNMPPDEGLNNEADKAIRLVDYLHEITKLKSGIVRQIKHEDDKGHVLWISKVPKLDGCFARAWDGEEDDDFEDIWLEIKSREEPEFPIVPALCQEWVEDEKLRDTSQVPELLAEIPRPIGFPDPPEAGDHPEFVPPSELLEDNPEIKREFDIYIEEHWTAWSG